MRAPAAGALGGRETLLARFQRLPRTLCHHDAFVRNLLLESTATGERVVAIDWSYIGTGALGEEIARAGGGQPHFSGPGGGAFPRSRGSRVGGLSGRAARRRLAGDVQPVRFAYAATSALVGAIGWVGVWMPYIVEHMDEIEELLGHAAAEMAEAWPQLLRHMLDLGEEALRLAGRM